MSKELIEQLAKEHGAELTDDINYLAMSIPQLEAFAKAYQAAAPIPADYVLVPHLKRGDTLGKEAAWKAFLKAMGSEMPTNGDGSYNGTFNYAVLESVNAYLTINHEDRYAAPIDNVAEALEKALNVVKQSVSMEHALLGIEALIPTQANRTEG